MSLPSLEATYPLSLTFPDSGYRQRAYRAAPTLNVSRSASRMGAHLQNAYRRHPAYKWVLKNQLLT